MKRNLRTSAFGTAGLHAVVKRRNLCRPAGIRFRYEDLGCPSTQRTPRADVSGSMEHDCLQPTAPRPAFRRPEP
jgi:hypothetical protein